MPHSLSRRWCRSLRVGPGVWMQREEWGTGLEIDMYGNRCERFMIGSGRSRIGCEAELLLDDPADLIESCTPETPVALLPDDVLSFVMRIRFCLPDELGSEAWRLFGVLAPWWGRVQALFGPHTLTGLRVRADQIIRPAAG